VPGWEIDPIVSVAFAIHSNKGAYALLLGSGLSRSAEIPTGWEIVLDLIRKVAALQGEDCEPDPAKWYAERVGEETDYSKLLSVLAPAQPERQAILSGYIEPTEEDKEEGKKTPTAAHRAIAKLVSSGHIKVIVTINFDRLLEQAIQDAGIVPTVIATADAAKGAMPMSHNVCTVLKLHGDYIDTRIRNTSTELSRYPTPFKRLLDRIFDEYGLVICGWSADWDGALRASLERCKTHRFTTYWTHRGKLTETALRLSELRKAVLVQIASADSFFPDLAEKIQSLEEFNRPHPLSVRTAVTTIKRYLPTPTDKIRLHDLVVEERERAYERLGAEQFDYRSPVNVDALQRRLSFYEGSVEILLALLVTGCHWGGKENHYLWVEAIERLGNCPMESGGMVVWIQLQMYPAAILLYGGGIAAVANARYDTLATLLTKPVIAGTTHQPSPALCRLDCIGVLPPDAMNMLHGEKRHTPSSDYLYDRLRAPLRDLIPADDRYANAFDRLEYLIALVFWDLCRKSWVPTGRFRWSFVSSRQVDPPWKQIDKELQEMGADCPLLQGGLFSGSLDRLREAQAGVLDFLRKVW
jgi:hypothetical protein